VYARRLDGANHPAVEPTWPARAIIAFCARMRLADRSRMGKSCAGTDRRKYPWGDAAPDRTRAQFGARFNETAPADAFPAGASPYGVLGMAGNTWNGCRARMPYPYRASDSREDLKAGPVRVVRWRRPRLCG
jgi:iron(II)-dependent oxidoreductase